MLKEHEIFEVLQVKYLNLTDENSDDFEKINEEEIKKFAGAYDVQDTYRDVLIRHHYQGDIYLFHNDYIAKSSTGRLFPISAKEFDELYTLAE